MSERISEEKKLAFLPNEDRPTPLNESQRTVRIIWLTPCRKATPICDRGVVDFHPIPIYVEVLECWAHISWLVWFAIPGLVAERRDKSPWAGRMSIVAAIVTRFWRRRRYFGRARFLHCLPPHLLIIKVITLRQCARCSPLCVTSFHLQQRKFRHADCQVGWIYSTALDKPFV